MQLQGIGVEHYRHWWGLFKGHARRLFALEVADEFLVAARRITARLQDAYLGRVEMAWREQA